MRTLSIAALIALSAMAGLMHAQGSPQRRDADRRQQIQREETLREREREARTTCALPDASGHPLNDVVSYEGQTYRCVEVFAPTPAPLVPPGESQTLTVRMVGWVKVP
jgi:hypothetical protein